MNTVAALGGAFFISGLMLAAALLLLIGTGHQTPSRRILVVAWLWGSVAILAFAAVAAGL